MTKANANYLVHTLSLYSFFLLFVTSSTFAQEQEEATPKPKNNGLDMSLGYGNSYLNVTGNMLSIISRQGSASVFLKLGTGLYLQTDGWDSWSASSIYGQFGLLFGEGKHQIEAGIGPMLYLGYNRVTEFPISGTLGYRFHEVEEDKIHRFYRFGFSFAEGLYIGAGRSF